MSEKNFENPYARPDGGTYVPGIQENAPQVKIDTNKQRQEPCVGFLYSISRHGTGEYWPLHVGRNIIGRSSECEICLKEETVSQKHAMIMIKKQKTTGKFIASIRDEGSKTGIFVNDNELGYDAYDCKNNDVILIGENYKLLFVLIQPSEYGLSVAENFRPVDEEEAPQESNKIANTPTLYQARNWDTGTVDLNGGDFEDGGNTVQQ